MAILYPGGQGNEGAYLRDLFVKYLPERAKKAVFGPSLAQAKQIAAILAFTAAVGLGYLYGLTKPRRELLREESG